MNAKTDVRITLLIMRVTIANILILFIFISYSYLIHILILFLSCHVKKKTFHESILLKEKQRNFQFISYVTFIPVMFIVRPFKSLITTIIGREVS